MLTTTVYWLLSGSKEQVEQAHPIKHFHYGMSPPRKYPVPEAFATKIRNVPYRANMAAVQRCKRPACCADFWREQNPSSLPVRNGRRQQILQAI